MKMRWNWGWALAALVLLGMSLALGFVLSLLGGGPLGMERHSVWLFWLNLVVAILLLLLLLVMLVRLWVRLRRGMFGSRLLIKLAGIFTLVGVLPGALIYTVSYQFVSRSIEAWFDAKVESALDAGLSLGRASLEAFKEDLEHRGRLAADRLAADRVFDGRRRDALVEVDRLREQFGVSSMQVVDGEGRGLVMAAESGDLSLHSPDMGMLREARRDRVSVRVEGLDDDAVAPEHAVGRMRAVVRVPSVRSSFDASSERYLVLTQRLPSTLTANALVVQSAYREYQQRHLARDGLRHTYIGTLTLSLALSVSGAVALGDGAGQPVGSAFAPAGRRHAASRTGRFALQACVHLPR